MTCTTFIRGTGLIRSNLPSSPSNCSMASTALSCVLWWRWLGILVMFHGMERHRGIRTDSQDAARTAGGHSAQDMAIKDTESPGESMTRGDTAATPVKVLCTTEKQEPGFCFLFWFFFFNLLQPAAAGRSAGSSTSCSLIQPFSSPPLPPLSVRFLHSPPLLPFASPFSPPLFLSYPPCWKIDSF